MNNGTLIMPSNYAVMDEEEMTYAEGGGTLKLKIGSNSFVVGALSALGGHLTRAAATAALDAIGLAIAGSIEIGTAGAGTLFVGAFILAWGGVASTIAGFAATYGINQLKGRTFTMSGRFIPNASFTI